MVRGLRQGGVDQAIRPIAWDRPADPITNLTQVSRNLERAGLIADQIVEYHHQFPDAPISLVGFSGGGGLAVLSAEALPEQFPLDRVILIGAALSPQYDLSAVLRRCRRGLVSFYSPQDWLVLDAGTRLFGTIDRQVVTAAGCVGFRDDQGRLLETPLLTQIAWDRRWLRWGHDGSHLGWLSEAWGREVLAPWLHRPDVYAADRSMPVRALILAR